MHNRIIQLTEDGSHTIAIPELNVTYHSKHGALQERMHVFIHAGLDYFKYCNPLQNETINIFEVGFGTGLNALVSLVYAIEYNLQINYQTIELYPLLSDEAHNLNYVFLTNQNLKTTFYAMHNCDWNKRIELHQLFSFKKVKESLLDFKTTEQFNIIYFDAFDPTVQPELWTEDIFKKMYELLYTNGLLITYCSKGSVQRAMKAAGFTIEKLKGPPGKREIIRAIKI